MNITQGKAVRAYSTLVAIGKRQLNTGTAFKFFKLKKALDPILEFQSEQEQNLAKELGGEFAENGRLMLPEEKRVEYKVRHKELEETECEVNADRISIPISELPYATIDEIDALDPFVEFTE